MPVAPVSGTDFSLPQDFTGSEGSQDQWNQSLDLNLQNPEGTLEDPEGTLVDPEIALPDPEIALPDPEVGLEDNSAQQIGGAGGGGDSTGWQAEWDRRVQAMEAAKAAGDEAMVQFYQGELNVMAPTMAALGIQVEAPGGGDGATSDGSTSDGAMPDGSSPDSSDPESLIPDSSIPDGSVSDGSGSSDGGVNKPDSGLPEVNGNTTDLVGPANGKWDALIEKHAAAYNMDPNLIKQIMAQESQGDPSAISPAGAYGLMQVKVGTASDMAGRPVTEQELLTNHDLNIQLGVKYIAKMFAETDGTTESALGAYNQGPGGDWHNAEATDYKQKIMGGMSSGELVSWT